MRITEDDVYRSSSQFRNWTFTPAQLAATRLQTNIQAAEHIKARIAKQRATRAAQGETENGNANGNGADGTESGAVSPNPTNGAGGPVKGTADNEVDCLTAEEENKLLNKFCETALELGTFLGLPIEVTATGIQFVRRFYLHNSPMTYTPITIVRAAMFIACKCEDFPLRLDEYYPKIPNTTRDSILAPEYLITQALRFNFDIKHPFRGLKAGHLEMIEMANGNLALPPYISTQTDGNNDTDTNAPPRTPEDIAKAMHHIPSRSGRPAPATGFSHSELQQRMTNAYTFASNILKSSALLTDAYFLYTPSHIWLAAHHVADPGLTEFYISTKFPPSPSSSLHAKLLTTIHTCASLLNSHPSTTSGPHGMSIPTIPPASTASKSEIARINKKLKTCRDPDRIDLIKLQESKKRDALATAEEGADGEPKLEESKAKRRKIAREENEREADAFWGPKLGGGGSGNGGAGKKESGKKETDDVF